jgi:hypothetical protein
MATKKKTPKVLRIYEITVNYEYGCCETYTVKAYSRAEANKKAKTKFIKDYFRSSYLHCGLESSELA